MANSLAKHGANLLPLTELLQKGHFPKNIHMNYILWAVLSSYYQVDPQYESKTPGQSTLIIVLHKKNYSEYKSNNLVSCICI